MRELLRKIEYILGDSNIGIEVIAIDKTDGSFIVYTDRKGPDELEYQLDIKVLNSQTVEIAFDDPFPDIPQIIKVSKSPWAIAALLEARLMGI